MGRVNEFQQAQLASQVVGTPGVDNSGAQIAQDVSGIAAGSASTALATESLNQGRQNQLVAQLDQRANQNRVEGFQQLRGAANDIGYEIQAHMVAKAQLEAAQAKAKDDIDIATGATDRNTRLGALYNKTKQDYQNNPDGAAKAFNEQGKQLLEDSLNNSSMSQAAQLGIRKHVLERLGSHSDSLNDWSFTQGNKLAGERVDGSIQNIVDSVANNPGDFETFKRSLQDVGALVPQIVATKGGAAPVEMGKARAAISEAFAAPLARQDPKRLIGLIEEDKFKGIMPGEKIDSLYKQAEAQIKVNEEVQTKQELITHQTRSTDIENIVSKVQDISPEDSQARHDLRMELTSRADDIRNKVSADLQNQQLGLPPSSQTKYWGEELKQITSAQHQLDSEDKSDVNAQIASDKADAAEHRRDLRDEKAAAVQAAKDARQEAINKFNSPETQALGSKVIETRGLLTDNAKIVGSSNELQAVIAFKNAAIAAQRAGAYELPGEHKGRYKADIGLAQEKLKRIAAAAGQAQASQDRVNSNPLTKWADDAWASLPGAKVNTPPSTIKSEAEKYYEQLVKGPSTNLMEAVNPSGDPHQAKVYSAEYYSRRDSAIKELEAKKGDRLSVNELKKLEQNIDQFFVTRVGHN